MKKSKPLSWKPVRRDDIYCAPACGFDCTHEAFMDAHKSAAETIAKMKTKGWKAHVWENIGWHWALTNTRCGMSLHVEGGSGKFWCMMDDGDATDTTSGSILIASTGFHKNPNAAVSEMFKRAEPLFKSYVRGLANLRSIQPK